jgi:hypothetical protein
VSLRLAHDGTIKTLESEHEAAKRAACEEIEKKNTEVFNNLAGAKSRREMEMQKTIDALATEKEQLVAEKERASEQLQAVMASNRILSPISPQEEQVEGIISDFKKRKLDQFEGSPESKSNRAWGQQAMKIGSIISSMVPDSPVDMDQAYYQISRCFALSCAIDNFKSYHKSGDGRWLCLASVLASGVENANAIEDANSICGWCQEVELDCCVQVQWRLDVVRFRTASEIE